MTGHKPQTYYLKSDLRMKRGNNTHSRNIRPYAKRNPHVYVAYEWERGRDHGSSAKRFGRQSRLGQKNPIESTVSAIKINVREELKRNSHFSGNGTRNIDFRSFGFVTCGGQYGYSDGSKFGLHQTVSSSPIYITQQIGCHIGESDVYTETSQKAAARSIPTGGGFWTFQHPCRPQKKKKRRAFVSKCL